MGNADAAAVIRHSARGMRGHVDVGHLVEAVGESQVVLLGEASHGTAEFYECRAAITRELIEKRGFCAVVVEGDWPDAYRVNRYVRGSGGVGSDADAEGALRGFERFPQWMWRNETVVELVEWMRGWNSRRGQKERVGFYGMDLYSMYSSMEEVLKFLEKTEPELARAARERYSCFEMFERDPQKYGYTASFRPKLSCREEAVKQLMELQARATELAKRDGVLAEDEYFFAEQNARLVKNAEAYYREMYLGEMDTWNLRDTHMVDSIEAIVSHLEKTRGKEVRVVVWAHNSHLGDARATEMGWGRGEVNVGQLCRERFGQEAVFNLGFTTHRGTVMAASNWGEDPEVMKVRPSMEGSVERLMHEVSEASGEGVFSVVMRDSPAAARVLKETMLERAIGVIYRPATERMSHYFDARPGEQFDAIVHVEESHAVRALERHAPFEPEGAETYPSGV